MVKIKNHPRVGFGDFPLSGIIEKGLHLQYMYAETPQ
jgi:hypothetical protein